MAEPTAPDNNEQQCLASNPVKREPRPYQTELVEHALRENTIVNLGTGAGKTFVAVMLIREMSHQTQGKFREEEGGKRTVFLAHTVPLVKQQGKYVRDNTSLKVQDFCGDSKGIDNWPPEKWYNLFDSNNVLAMSRQIFLDLLTRAIVKPRDLNLIVFDECHHASKNDPYVQIMKVIKDAPPEERPRILGLSASLLGTKVKPGELKKGVASLETILMSRARTSKDLQEVVRYATTPSEKIANYTLCEDEVSGELKRIIEEPMKFLQTKHSDKKLRFPMGEVAKNLFEDLYSILMDLGPASAASFVKVALSELKKNMLVARNDDRFDYGLVTLGLTHLTIFDIKCREFEQKYNTLDDSNKVKTLLLALGDVCVQLHNDESSGSDESPSTGGDVKKKTKSDLRGIIFVERRYTASCLSELLKKKRKEQPDLRHIRCDYVVGHNVGQNTTSIRKDARMKSKKQDDVLSKFRSGKITILIATSVIEEGVDVPKCNLVVRFDLPQNFRAYVQSKGRARNKPSLFYLLIGDHQQNKLVDIANYHNLEKELIEICQEERRVPSEESIQEKMRDKIPPYFARGRDEARATLGNSLTILHRYCQRLPHDDYTKLVPSFEVLKIPKDRLIGSLTLFGEDEEDEDPKYDYICTITLPINCPIKTPIEGPAMGSKLQANRAAALYAVEELHKKRELNDKFFPSPLYDSDDEEVQKEKTNPQAGTERRQWYCRNEVSECLKDCTPRSDAEVFVYVFVLRDASTQQLYSSFISGNGPYIMMGLLTIKPLPYWKIPKYSLFIKGEEERETEVSVTLLPLPDQLQFSEEELVVLKTCHQSIFSDVLKIIPSYLQYDFSQSEKGYIIAPVTVSGVDGDMVLSGRINYDIVSTIAVPQEHAKQTWPCPLALYDDALVSVVHRQAIALPVGEELYKVTVDHTLTPRSPFPTPQFNSFQEYYKVKHNYDMKDLNQPALRACRVGVSSLKYLTSRYVGVSPTSQSKQKESRAHTFLFPEVVKIYPIAANIFKLLKCLPSILWRLEALLLAEEISVELHFSDLCFDTRIFTDMSLKGYGDIGYGILPTQVLKYNKSGDFTHRADEAVPRRNTYSRVPDNGLLLQALMPKAANDSINLERLELLGDALLKIASSIYLLNARPDADERKLSSARSRRVSNLKLFVQAQRKGFCGKIQSNDMFMGSESDSSLDRLRFLPPGYVLGPEYLSSSQLPYNLCPENINTIKVEEIKYLYHRFSDKMVADCMEALIGAYTVSGGIEGGLRFMEWLEVGVTMPNDVKTHLGLESNTDFSMTVDDESSPLTIAQSSCIFRKYYGTPVLIADVAVADRETFNRLLHQVGNVQMKIEYRFTNHSLLIEALTHSSYARKTLCGCYQRLEFLGDAVLDYLITSYLYNLDQYMTPGTISSIRSALVCNHSLAELTVTTNLHKNLLHSSPELFKKIPIYADAVKNASADVVPELGDLSLEELGGGDESGSESEEEDIEVEDEDVTLDPPKPLADIFEALCGAVFLDTNMDLGKTWEVFGQFFEPKINEYRQSNGGIPVNQVKRLFDLVPEGIQVKRKVLKYGYCCTIKIKDKDIEVDGISRNYKNAKILAANKALIALFPDTNTSS